MNKMLKTIYDALTVQEITETPFHTTEIDEKFSTFFDTYFRDDIMTRDEYDTAIKKFCDFSNAVEENAFEVGFYTAVKLLTEDSKVLKQL